MVFEYELPIKLQSKDVEFELARMEPQSRPSEYRENSQVQDLITKALVLLGSSTICTSDC